MTEKTVKISITTEINGKAVNREVKAEAGSLDGELIKIMSEMIRETIRGGLEAIDEISTGNECGSHDGGMASNAELIPRGSG
jgi:hypothetical protein